MEKRRKKKKEPTPVTLLIIPDIRLKPVHFNVTKRVIIGGVAAVAVFVLAFFILGYSHLAGLNDLRHIQDIKQESTSKDLTIEQMRQEMDEIKKQQEQIDQKQQEIQKLMGIKQDTQPNPSRGSQGGQGRETVQAEVKNTIQASDIMKRLISEEQELDNMLPKVMNDLAYFRAIPSQWPVKGEISSDYGLRSSPFGSRKESFHDGIDIKNQVGTEIVAAADGEVIYAGWMAVYGKAVLINHGNGLESKYGHNSQLLVKKGDRVKKGDVIALMGTTGLSTGPHLHFSITKNGILQDPLVYLP